MNVILLAIAFVVLCLASPIAASGIVGAAGDVNVASLVVGCILVTGYIGITVAATVYWFRNLREKPDNSYQIISS